uniref:GDSL esterase/lipase n=1 Tax=Oryza brachyantha TaxID=4533 RepID=J3MFG3_ORYBR
MRITWLAAAAALCCVGAAACAGGQGQCKFRAVLSFGDSNSDTRGFWAAFPVQQAPFGMTYDFRQPAGRASDGRLVIDFLGKHPNTVLFVTGTSPFFLGVQLNQMKELRTKALRSNGNNAQLPAPDVLSNSLYTIDIGQNDLTSNLGSQSIETVKQSLPSFVSQITSTELYNIGARNIMVFNMAPIGCYPAFLTKLPHASNDMDGFGCMKTYSSAVTYYNELLNTSLAEVRKKLQDASLVYADKHAVILELFGHPKAHGLKYGTKACCGYGDGVYNSNPDVYFLHIFIRMVTHELKSQRYHIKKYGGSTVEAEVLNGQSASAKACADPPNYASWDGIHGTEAANKIIASSLMRGSGLV